MTIDGMQDEFRRIAMQAIHSRIETSVQIDERYIYFTVSDATKTRCMHIARYTMETDPMPIPSIVDMLRKEMES